MKELLFTSAAARQWGKLPDTIRSRINARLETYATTGHGDVKKLKGRAGARLRVGDWRVIFFEDARTITVVAVGNRRDIYD